MSDVLERPTKDLTKRRRPDTIKDGAEHSFVDGKSPDSGFFYASNTSGDGGIEYPLGNTPAASTSCVQPPAPETVSVDSEYNCGVTDMSNNHLSDDSIRDLIFIKKKNGKIVKYWINSSTGCPDRDYELGRSFAATVMGIIFDSQEETLLHKIIDDMPNDKGKVEEGFINEITNRAEGLKELIGESLSK